MQLSEWQAYDRLDPVGKWRGELGWASLCSLITNITKQLYSEKGKKPEFVSPNDFMIKWGEIEEQEPEPKKQSVEEMNQILSDIAKAQGTKDKKK